MHGLPMAVQMQHMVQQLRLRLSFCLSPSPTLPTSAITPLQSTAAAPVMAVVWLLFMVSHLNFVP